MRRRRRCPQCEQRFTTFERRERAAAWVIKRDGKRQPFNADKLRAGLGRAAHKRPVSPADLDALVDRISFEAERAGGELTAAAIRQICMDGLRRIDPGAYLQFAGVETSDLDSFRDELARLDNRKDGDFVALGAVGSVRGGEDYPLLPPKPGSERARGEL